MLGAPVFRTALFGPWSGNALWTAARAVPSLDLCFADKKDLICASSGRQLVTFARASSGTYVDSAGVLQTAATDVPRFDHNPLTGESLGLLVEEQRTNLLLNTATLSTQSVTVTAAAHTLSFYGSGTVTLSGASTAGPAVGSGAFPARTTLTFTPSAGTLTLTVTGSVTSAQLEAGAFPTSYIPTTTAAATRNADVASITGANFSSWYRQDEGTMFAFSSSYGATNSSRRIAFASDGTTANRFGLLYNNSNNPQLVVASAGTLTAIPNVALTGATYAIAAAYKLDDYAISAAGSAPNTDTSGALPVSINQLDIGSQLNGEFVNGTIRRLTYWPQRLPNSTLQAITQ